MFEKSMNKIPEEAAQKQLDILIDYYELDTENDVLKNNLLPNLLKSIMRGRIEFSLDKEGDLVTRQILKKKVGENTTEINYEVISGKHKEQMKTEYKSEFSKYYALLGSLSGGNKIGISRLTGIDLSVAETLGATFLLV
jgi:hypothetical protein